jgi:hypothetical protein
MSGIISYCSRPELADVEVIIHEVSQEAPANAGHKRDREEQLAMPGHKLVLCAVGALACEACRCIVTLTGGWLPSLIAVTD